ncbi:hypothetical protein [Pseudobutyrivibrio sp.]|uniref:hypothetical protein n=1 Tax=Pseudobutyrivibrio sp. TaxID=2014367 RepID=UPI0038684EAB
MKQIVDKLNKIAKKINENVELSDRDLIIDSLDSITKAYGGTPNDSTLIVDKLDDIYNNIGSAPSGNIEITENTAEGEPLDISQYATATVNVSGGGGLTVYTCTLHCHNGLDEPFDFADMIVSTPSAYAIDPETNYLMPAINISAVVEPGESLDIVMFIQAVEGGFMACVFDGEYSSTMLYNAVNCSSIYDSTRDQTAIVCEQDKNAEITFDVGGVN